MGTSNGIADDWFGVEKPQLKTVTASDYETKLQNWLTNSIYTWAKQGLNQATTQGANNTYDTNNLKLELNPTITNLKNSEGYVSGISQDLLKTPTLTKNFATLNKDDVYSGLMADVNRQADIQKAQNREQLMESGIANSTILTNVNDKVNQNVLDRSVDASATAAQQVYDSNLKSQQLSNQAVLNENNARSQGIKDFISGRLAIDNSILGLANKETENQLYNRQTDYNEFLRQQASAENKIANIISLFNGQAGIQSTAMDAANKANIAAYNSAAQDQSNFYGALGNVFGK